jgi:glycosyltransferase involved in cell wall biosynthesis
VPHGLPERLLRFSATPPGGYVAFLGRIAPEKGPDRAIRIAQRTGMPLRIAAKVDPVDKAFFQRIEPLLGRSGIEFVGEINEAQKSNFLGHAAALLFPIDWPEPFGLVVIEAMACGTPVIAWRNGSVPELIEDGRTGFIVESEDDAVAALARIREIDRREVRRSFERRFTATNMARNYLRVYGRLAARPRDADMVGRAASFPLSDKGVHMAKEA